MASLGVGEDSSGTGIERGGQGSWDTRKEFILWSHKEMETYPPDLGTRPSPRPIKLSGLRLKVRGTW